jgi:hypothetical protein
LYRAGQLSRAFEPAAGIRAAIPAVAGVAAAGDKKLSPYRDSNLASGIAGKRMQPLAPDRRLRAAMKHGLIRLISAARPRRRAVNRRRARHPVGSPAAAVDPVALTVLAVNRLGPATLRTVANGKPQTVKVPDARTGEIFRAALAQMQRTRLTDRLIDIVIADEAPDAGRAATSA